jgi:hypothetical protein
LFSAKNEISLEEESVRNAGGYLFSGSDLAGKHNISPKIERPNRIGDFAIDYQLIFQWAPIHRDGRTANLLYLKLHGESEEEDKEGK